jgi:hypothetical protein
LTPNPVTRILYLSAHWPGGTERTIVAAAGAATEQAPKPFRLVHPSVCTFPSLCCTGADTRGATPTKLALLAQQLRMRVRAVQDLVARCPKVRTGEGGYTAPLLRRKRCSARLNVKGSCSATPEQASQASVFLFTQMRRCHHKANRTAWACASKNSPPDRMHIVA